MQVAASPAEELVQVDTAMREALESVRTEPGELPRLELSADGETLQLPLSHTAVQIRVTGPVARVEVKQSYRNPKPNPIEAIYVFPLPENSAVDGMTMVIGGRRIVAEIKRRQEARQTYDDAKRDGHTAALLEAERRNVFTQSVANIPPGEAIDVVISYVQTLTYDAGRYEVVFPMVVGPRFIPGVPLGRRSGHGSAEDTDRVPDASRITPPVLGAGVRSGHDLSLEVLVDPGVAIGGWEVPTHDVEEHSGGAPLHLTLAAHDRIPNRDFVLFYDVAGEKAQAALLTQKEAKDGDSRYFTLMVQPPDLDVDQLVGDRELVFVVDVSGSMSGVPLAMCQDAMREAIRRLRPSDTFNVITFASGEARLFEEPRPANDTHLQAALEFVDGLYAGGGTMMGAGVAAALSPAVAPGRQRYVFFLTDGYVGNDDEITRLVRQFIGNLSAKQQRARVFSFGVGSSTNRALLEEIAHYGRGLAFYASTREDPLLAVNRYFNVIDKAVMTQVQVDWGHLTVREVLPAVVPDLFATRPLVLHGKLEGRGRARIVVSGWADRRRVELPLEVDLDQTRADDVLGTLWARAEIEELERDALVAVHGGDPVEAITRLAFEHRLVTAYTSFVAVDRSRKVDGSSTTVVQPVECPEGVDCTMAGAEVVRAPGRYQVNGIIGKLSVGGGGGGPMTRGQAALLRGGGGGGGVARAPAGVLGQLSKRGGSASSGPAVGGLVQNNPGAMRSVGQGSLDRDAIQKVVNQNIAQIQRCYERELLRHPGLSGKLQIEWTIGKDGRVARVRLVYDSLGSSAVANCIMTAIRGWSFPAPQGGEVVVSYPFIFKSIGF
jgi:Ca-activated chloride channel family protein